MTIKVTDAWRMATLNASIRWLKMICKASQDEAVHAEILGAQDEKELAIENLAEDLMSNVEQKISCGVNAIKQRI